ncbi:MAG TPA: diguanylate cyclase [Epulopiscium sp.]|nr:diguanylate cyclase [Candidatus Epulonipiscium sp.]
MINKKVFLSPMWKGILGYSDDEIGDYIEAREKLGHPDDKDKMHKAGTDYVEGKSKHYEVIHRLKHKDGHWRWILTRGGILRDEKGTPYRWIGTNIDITTEHEQALEFERFLSVNLDLLCTVDMEGKFLKTNQAWEDMLGYPSSELKGRRFLEFVHPDDIPSTLEIMGKGKKGKHVLQFVNRYISADGTYHYIEWRSIPYEGTIYAAAHDITERIEYEKKILDISNRDTLTNVYNRRYVFQRLEEILEEYKRVGKIFSVCILDIDFFKKINDSYGHQAGDYILKEFTRNIGENLRPYDILGRYGGEEFIVILNNSDQYQSQVVIGRILDIIRNKIFVFRDEKIKFTFSAGIVSGNEISKDEIIIDRLVELADKRMYGAKKTGRNKIIFE